MQGFFVEYCSKPAIGLTNETWVRIPSGLDRDAIAFVSIEGGHLFLASDYSCSKTTFKLKFPQQFNLGEFRNSELGCQVFFVNDKRINEPSWGFEPGSNGSQVFCPTSVTGAAA